MGNADLRETKQIVYQSKGIDESYPKMYFFLHLSHYVKSCGHFCQILAFFYDARSANMVISRDPRSKFPKICYFVLILHLILGKVTKFLVESFLLQKLLAKNLTGEWKTTPPPVLDLQQLHSSPASDLEAQLLSINVDTMVWTVSSFSDEMSPNISR